jgi:membrane fusion protein (multidrug efflux system)
MSNLSGKQWLVALGLSFASLGFTSNSVANQLVIKSVVEEASVTESIMGLGEVIAKRHVELQPSVTERVVAVHFSDGDWVEAGQLLVTLDQAEVRAQLAELEVRLVDAERQLIRLQTLQARGDMSQAAVDEADLMRQTLRAQRELLNVRLSRLELRAPFAGRLGVRQVNEGAMASPGLVITDLIELDDVLVDFNLPARFLSDVAVGQRVLLESGLVATDNLVGEVVTVFSSLDPATRTFAVRAKFTNADYRLLPGMGMTVRLNKTPRRLLRVPETAVVPMADQNFVYVLKPQADSELFEVERREVVLGAREPGWVELVSGAELGEAVISQGALRVRPGQQVKVADQLRQISEFAQ